MELSKEQILYLYDFVTSKYVRYEDVKHEIVDHLACGIEERMSSSPDITFERALDAEYSKFPITGFAKWIMEKEKALQIYWRKKLGRAFLRWLFSKDILAPLAILLLSIMVFQYVPYGFHILVLVTFLCSAYSVYDLYKNKIQDKANKYLSTSVLMQYNLGSIISFHVLIWCDDFWLFTKYTEANFQTIGMFVLLAFMGFFLYYQHHCFPKLFKAELQKINRLSIAS